MPYNGSGTFNVYTPGNPVVTGTTISSTVQNNTTADFANGLSNCITRDGQGPATSNISLGSNQINNLANGTHLTDAVNYTQVQNSNLQFATATGTNTILLTTAVAPASYGQGQTFRFVAAGANTGAVTINLDSLGAKALTKGGATALVGGEIANGAMIEIVYDGTQFQLQNSMMLSTGFLLGRSTAGTGNAEQITVGNGLLLTAGTLTGPFFSGQNNPATITNTGLTTVAYSVSIPGGTLGTLSGIVMQMNAEFQNNSGSSTTLQIQISYGGTAVADSGIVGWAAAAAFRPVSVDMLLTGAGATNAQNCRTTFRISAATGINAPASTSVTDFITTSTYNNSAVDSTIAKTLVVNITMGNASTSINFNSLYAYVEAI